MLIDYIEAILKKSPKTFIKKKTCEIKSPLSSAISNT